jgi:hypothetical protein
MIVSSENSHCLQWFHRLTSNSKSTHTHARSFGQYGQRRLGHFNGPAGLCLQPHTRHLLVCDQLNHRIQILSNPHDSQHSKSPVPLYAFGSPSDGKSDVERRDDLEDGDGKGDDEDDDEDDDENDEDDEDDEDGEEDEDDEDVEEDEDDEDEKRLGLLRCPQGVCCAASGGIAVADSGFRRVQLFDASGRFISTFTHHRSGSEDLFLPCDLTYLQPPFLSTSWIASSVLCVADHNNKRVSMWSGDGQQHLFNLQVSGLARGLCVDLHGYLHVSCGDSSHVIQIFDPRQSFRLVQTLGKQGKGGQGTHLGEFNDPIGMCVDDHNTLMVCDYYNHRIQFFPQL